MDYEAAYQRMLSNPAGDDTMLDHMFPNREECKAFLDWLDEKTTTAIQALSQPKFTREELVARIDSSNLLAQSFANTVLPALETPIRPWIPVGHDNHFLYRLYPKAYDLRPDSDRWDYKVELPEHVLAFQNAEEKEEFAFLQLGKLEYTKDGLTHWPRTEDGTEDDVAAEKLPWKETGFNLVARVGSHGGHIDGVYAVFNMHVEDNFTGDTYTYSPSDNKWGRLPDPLDEEQFFCARLADKLGDFSGCHVVYWGQIAFYKPVPLVMLSKDRLVIDV